MMSKRTLVVVLTLALVSHFGWNAGVTGSQDELQLANQRFAEHSYKPALDAYRGVLAAEAVTKDDRGFAALRVGLCLERLQRWDVALTELEALEPRFSGEVWEARIRSLRGSIQLKMPHFIYRKGEESSRTDWIQGGTYNYTYYDDIISSLKLLSSAWELWRPYQPRMDDALAKTERLRRGEEIGQVGLDVAAALEAHRQQKGGLLGLRPHPDVLADLEANAPGVGKALSVDPQDWFSAVEKASLLVGLREQAAMARYLEATYCQRLLSQQGETKIVHERGQTTVSCRVNAGEEVPRFVQLPERSSPFALLKKVISEYPDTSVLDVAIFVLARLQNEAQLHVQALDTLDKFDERFPESRWNSDVKALRQEILFPRISCDNPSPVRPGAKVDLALRLRNVKEVEIRAYPFDLGQVMSSTRYLRDDELNLSELSAVLKKLERLAAVDRDAALVLKEATPDIGKHLFHEMKVALDLPKAGAYLVEVEGAATVYRVLALVSDIAIIRKTSDEATLVYVADATSSSPIEGAVVTVRQRHRARGLFGSYDKITWDSSVSGSDGLYRREHEASSGSSVYIEAFAQRGSDYALTLQSWSASKESEAENAILYGFTDRPVYRPGETVGWVANMRVKRGDDYENLAGQDFAVTVTDPKGNKIFEHSLETDDFGVIVGSLSVGEEPPLGTYNIQYRRGRRYVGGHAFRIEEYKKPEFEVLVHGPAEQVRAGDLVPVTITGLYYFGAPVTDGKVAWRIYRDSFAPSFNLREPYSWLYGRRKNREYRPQHGRELVAQGEGQTDESGKLVVTIESAAWRDRYPDEDHQFSIEADITDLSRRTISGSAGVVVPRRGLFAHVEASRGFFRAGETARFDLRVQTPQGAPVAGQGQINIFRVRARRDGKELVEERIQVFSAGAETTKSGLGSFDWQADAAGRFVVQYVTQDRWGEAVIGEQAIWVTDASYRADDFQFKNVELITDKSEYVPGETAFIMLNTVFPDSHVLVTVEAGSRLLSSRVLQTTGKTTVMSLEIPESFAPNVFVHAMTVHDGGFFEASSEIFVPPAHRFIDVGLRFDKPSYLPGEMAKLTLESRDHLGAPIAARFALRVMDRAITYIQDDATIDIRRFFYGNRRGFLGGDSWNTNTRNSQQFRFDGHLASGPKWIDYRQHGMPPGYWLDLSLTDSFYGGSSWGGDDHDGADKAEDQKLLDRGALALGEEAPNEEMEDSEEAGSPGLGLLGERSRGVRRKMGAPMAETASMERVAESKSAEGSIAQPELRGNFSDLATWQPDLRTGASGKTTIEFRFPDSLTDWEATARGLTKDTRVGMAETSVRTTKNIQVRLQAPRFFTETDRIVLSTVLRNDFAESVEAEVVLEVEGGTLELEAPIARKLRLEGGSEVRVDWPCLVLKSGEARITAKVLTARESDAVQMRFPVLAYGITKTLTRSIILEGDDATASFPLDVPAERRVAETRLELNLSPSLAATLLESLPYLIEYPYGCTEQTMSRFMPAVVVARTIKEMGTSLEEIQKRRKDLDNRDALNVRAVSPIYADAELESIVAAGLRRLESMQNSDGGFGWWRLDKSSVHLTSYVLQGLGEARAAGRSVPDSMVNRAADWLESQVKDIDDLQAKAYAAYALAKSGRKPNALLEAVFKKRDDLGTQNKAQLAIALHLAGKTEQAALVLTNLEDFVRTDDVQGVAWWPGGGSWWRWYDDEIETNAWVLLAMTEIAPDHRLARPLARWLIYNRSGNRWKSTRDTALAVLALARYAKGAGELAPDYEIVVRWGDSVLKRQKVDAANMFVFDNRVVIEGDAIPSGPLPLVVERVGKGALYVDCRLSYFSREDRITAAGYQIEVRREYHLLEPIEKEVERGGRKIKILDYKRTKLDHLADLQAGDEVEVKLFVTAANNYEYILLEDRKPAGFEPVELRSGGRYGNGVCSNMELRDEKVAFFLTWLQKGTHEISYRMRAEAPGTINAMPSRVEAMYAPKLGGISDSWRVIVSDPTN